MEYLSLITTLRRLWKKVPHGTDIDPRVFHLPEDAAQREMCMIKLKELQLWMIFFQVMENEKAGG